MKKLFLTVILSFYSLQLFAQSNCLNKAKYYAIKAYHAEMGTVQGSDGISYMAKLLEQDSNLYKYVVTIQDNNEDGDTWIVDYLVVIDNSLKTCKKISVSNEGSRE